MNACPSRVPSNVCTRKCHALLIAKLVLTKRAIIHVLMSTNFVSPYMAWCNASNKEQNALTSAMANALLRINTLSKTVTMSTIVV